MMSSFSMRRVTLIRQLKCLPNFHFPLQSVWQCELCVQWPVSASFIPKGFLPPSPPPPPRIFCLYSCWSLYPQQLNKWTLLSGSGDCIPKINNKFNHSYLAAAEYFISIIFYTTLYVIFRMHVSLTHRAFDKIVSWVEFQYFTISHLWNFLIHTVRVVYIII